MGLELVIVEETSIGVSAEIRERLEVDKGSMLADNKEINTNVRMREVSGSVFEEIVGCLQKFVSIYNSRLVCRFEKREFI
jgi:hypothetical protein